MKTEDKIMAAGMLLIALYSLLGIGTLLGLGFVVYKTMQHFGVL